MHDMIVLFRIVMALLLLTSCLEKDYKFESQQMDSGKKVINGNGVFSVKEFEVPEQLDRVTIDGNFSVEIHQTEMGNKMELHCEENLSKFIGVDINSKTINVYHTKSESNLTFNSNGYTIKLYVNDIKNLSLFKNVIFSGDLKLKDLNIESKQNSKITLNGNIDDLEVNAYENSKIKISGEGNKLRITSKGNSKVEAKSFKVNYVEIFNSDLSEIKIHVKEEMKVSNQNGTVFYASEPNLKLNIINNTGELKTF